MRKFKKTPSNWYLLECFDYNEVTGDFRWKKRPREHFRSITEWFEFNKEHRGEPAGNLIGENLVVSLQGDKFQVKRVIWKLCHGTDSKKHIIQLDGNNMNLRLSNLVEG